MRLMTVLKNSGWRSSTKPGGGHVFLMTANMNFFDTSSDYFCGKAICWISVFNAAQCVLGSKVKRKKVYAGQNGDK